MYLKACIFDLDGVIVDTAKYHYLSWKRLASELGIEFTEEDNKHLKGVSRIGSLEYILELGKLKVSDRQKEILSDRKNSWYLKFIDEMTRQEILPGAIEFLDTLDKEKIKIALGSGSKNARAILQKINLTNRFHAIVDGTDTTHGKPNPEVFLKAAERLNLPAENCIVFEDAYKGIQAAKSGNFFAVGIGDQNDMEIADLVYEGLHQVEFTVLKEAFESYFNKIPKFKTG